MYCFTAICSSSFSFVEMARGKPRICEPLILCSSNRKYCDDIVIPALAPRSQPDKTLYKEEGLKEAIRDEEVVSVFSPGDFERSMGFAIVDEDIVESLGRRCRDELPRIWGRSNAEVHARTALATGKLLKRKATDIISLSIAQAEADQHSITLKRSALLLVQSDARG